MTPEELAATSQAPAASPAPGGGAAPPPSLESAKVTLALDPLEAARAVAPGKPCPVCGGGPLASLSAHDPELGRSMELIPGAACICTACGFKARGLPGTAANVIRTLLFLALGAVLAAIGFGFVRAQRESPWTHVGGIALHVCALLSPIVAYGEWRKARKKLAAKIGAARARFERAAEEREIRIDPHALLRAAAVGKECPVCGKAPLEGLEPSFLWSRSNLRCPKCRLDVPVTLTQIGFSLGLAVAAALVIAGAYALLAARDSIGNEFMLKGMLGIVLALAGIYTGVILQGAGDEPARKELETAKRRFERRKRGLSSRDEDEPGAWFQENLEAVVVAVILALVIRHFVMEAFVIPTGSMAPTLLGDHFEATCKNCRYHFAVAKSEGDMNASGESIRARCPLCGEETDNTFHSPDVHGGNKILVNKFIYKLSEPERWNVIVFKYPKNPSRNFIKRLVGLPGEWLRIDKRGDVWTKKNEADPWVLARKPKAVQEELWMPVYDSRFPDLRKDQPAWEEDNTRWSVNRGRAGEELEARPGTGETWIRFRREIKDNYGYNKWQGEAHPTGDVRVRASVLPRKGARSIRLSLVENKEHALVASIPVADAAGAHDMPLLTLNGVPVSGVTVRTTRPLLQPDVPAEVSLAYADERATLTVNGEDVLEWDDPRAPAWTDSSSVSLGCDAGGAVFRDVRVDRDVFYVEGGRAEFDPRRLPEGLKIPDRCYFAMGDNSPNSQDGREWGFVHEPHMIGRAFLVFWPLWQVKLIR